MPPAANGLPLGKLLLSLFHFTIAILILEFFFHILTEKIVSATNEKKNAFKSQTIKAVEILKDFEM